MKQNLVMFIALIIIFSNIYIKNNTYANIAHALTVAYYIKYSSDKFKHVDILSQMHFVGGVFMVGHYGQKFI